jgi:hypothetical protein
MAQQWYSIVEYARAFSISDMTVRRRIKTGKLNAVLKDGKYFIPVDGSEAVNSGAQTAPTTPAPTRPPQSHPEMNAHLNYSNRNASSQFSSETPSYTAPRESQYQPQTRPKVTPNNIPSSVVRPMRDADSIVMRADQLIEYCDRMLGELKQAKNQNRELYESKIKTLQARLNAKEIELQQFRQQVEDLQVLVKILENKKS